MLSNYLAEVWGISMVVVSLALLVREKHLKRLFSKIESEESLFCWGIVSFVLGISTALAHNVWVASWPVVITILGWIAVLKGLIILFVPESFKVWAKKLEKQSWLPFAWLVVLVIGLVMTYLGFTA